MSCSVNLSPNLRRQSAFTLVELLVVIGIIAVLISILLPALNRARESGNLVKCEANLKQIGLAVMMYNNGNKGMLPYGFLNGASFKTDSSDWTTLVLNTLSGHHDVAYGVETYSKSLGQGGQRMMFVCPSATLEPSGSGGQTVLTHYGPHPRLMPDLDTIDHFYTDNRKMTTYKLSHIKRPAEIALIFDASLEPSLNYITRAVAFGLDGDARDLLPSLADDYTRVNKGAGTSGDPVSMKTYLNAKAGIPNADSDDNKGNIRFRHMRDSAANALMVDGHVQTFHYNKLTNTPDLLRRNVYVNP